MITVTPVSDDFVAEVSGLDIRHPLPVAVFEALEAALDRYAVLVLPNQPLTEAQQTQFARNFGTLETSIGATVYNADRKRRLDKPELSDISNLDEGGGVLDRTDVRRLINLSNQLWHTDSSFKRTPAKVSILSAQEIVPVGGQTEFADMRAAWDALPAERQAQLKDLVAEHDYFHSRALTGFDSGGVPEEWKQRVPPVPQVLVRRHPKSLRHSLYLASHIRRIHGMDEARGQALVDELMAFATRRAFTHTHRWRVDDVVIWDNRCTMHRGRPFDESYRRSMRRATVMDDGPTVPESRQAASAIAESA